MSALLRATGVSKAFGGVQALQDCTIEVQAGSISGLIGPNGSGKTTLFNVITGYERPDAGEVYFGDHQITGSAPQRVFAAGIGRTFQLTRIFPRLTVLENMIVAAQHSAGPGGRPPGTPRGAGSGGRPPGTPRGAGSGGRPPEPPACRLGGTPPRNPPRCRRRRAPLP